MSIKLMMRVWDDDKTSGATRIVLLALADQANDEGVCWPGLATIARRANINRRSVIRAIEELIEIGYIDKTARKVSDAMNLTNIYTLTIPEREKISGDTVTPPSDRMSPPSDRMSPPLVTQSHYPSDRMSPESSINPKLTTNKPSNNNIIDENQNLEAGDFVELSRAFTQASGLSELTPNPKSYFEALEIMKKGGVQPNDITQAVKLLQNKNYVIVGAKSIVSTAMSIAGSRKSSTTPIGYKPVSEVYGD